MEIIGTNGSYLNRVFAGLVGWAEYFESIHGGPKLENYTDPDGNTHSASMRRDEASKITEMFMEEYAKVKKVAPQMDVKSANEHAYNAVVDRMKTQETFYTEGTVQKSTKGIFSDYNGKNNEDLLKYVNKLIQPVADRENASFKGVDSPEVLQAKVAEFIKGMEKKIDELSKPPGNKGNGDTEGEDKNKQPKTKGGKAIYSDSLTSVGNMLGASFGGIGEVNAQLDVSKQQLVEQQKQNESTNKTLTFLTTIDASLKLLSTKDTWNQ